MIYENIRNLLTSIQNKCREVKRDPSEIKLIAVSKNFGTEEILAAKESGITDFGENRAQELTSKFEAIGQKVTWHFIGHLQKNKVRYAVRCASYIHSVDSLSLAQEISRRAVLENKSVKVLLQVKTSEEETKSGFENEDELFRAAEFCVKDEKIDLTGLMTISPLTDDESLIRKSFTELRSLREKMIAMGFPVKELSMGMTSDYEIAIEEGATILRIGSAIFGTRDYSKPWKEL